MNYWTYSEILEKVQSDLGMEDEDFIKPSEWLGYCNAGIEEAEKIIHTLYEDYFLTYKKIALVNGTALYDLPDDIFANKIRGFVYNDGAKIYDIKKFRERQKFAKIADGMTYSSESDYYMYFLINRINNSTPSTKIRLIPTAYETMPTTAIWVSGTAYYEGDIVYYSENKYESTNSPLWVSGTSYVIGDTVVYNGRNYECAVDNSDVVFTAINWTDNGVFTPATTFTASEWTDLGEETFRATLWYIRNANRMVDDDSICDIPEFTSYVMQYMKCEARKKEYNGEVPPSEQKKLEKLEAGMMSTLTDMIPDNDTIIEADYSHYEDSV